MVDQDLYEFLANISKVNEIVDITPVECANLATYQLKEVVYTWCKQLKSNRGVDVGPIEWDEYLTTFMDKFSHLS